MTGFNHVAGGFVFTGLFGSLMLGINILASPATLAITLISSLLPDIDHTRSTIGKVVYPLAKWLNRRFGHRTITHGMPCLCTLSILFAVLEKTFLGQLTFTGIFTLGYFSHLLLDMFTLQGVPLMYPFSRSPYVMIGNPESRIRTGDYRKEAIAFSVFVIVGFFLQPLFAKGFWTVWNQNLATLKHVHGEFLRSNDLLHVKYELLQGSTLIEGDGYCIESPSETQAWLLDSAGQWVQLQDPECRRSVPTHTGKPLDLRNQTFISIGPDSLNQILQGKTLLKIEVQGNQPFQVTEQNLFPKETQSYTADHLNRSPVFSSLIPHPSSLTDSFIPDRSFEAEIEALQSEIRRIERANAADRSAIERHAAQLAQLRRDYRRTSDVTRRQQLHDQIEELEKEKLPEPDDPDLDQGRTAELKDRIAKIRKENALKETAKRQEIELKNSQELAKMQETRLTGLLTFVLLDMPNRTPISAAPTPAGTILPPQSNQKTYKVIGVKDGDTIEAFDDSTRSSFTIRLAHVDCPEKSQAFGTKAKQFTSDFCFGKQISIQQTDTDRYGRKICLVYVEGKELNLALVEAGYAWHYKKYSTDMKYDTAEKAARSDRLGLWYDENPTPPWEWRAANRN